MPHNPSPDKLAFTNLPFFPNIPQALCYGSNSPHPRPVSKMLNDCMLCCSLEPPFFVSRLSPSFPTLPNCAPTSNQGRWSLSGHGQPGWPVTSNRGRRPWLRAWISMAQVRHVKRERQRANHAAREMWVLGRGVGDRRW